jgi:hypothetical protein
MAGQPDFQQAAQIPWMEQSRKRLPLLHRADGKIGEADGVGMLSRAEIRYKGRNCPVTGHMVSGDGEQLQ